MSRDELRSRQLSFNILCFFKGQEGGGGLWAGNRVKYFPRISTSSQSSQFPCEGGTSISFMGKMVEQRQSAPVAL